MTYFEGRPRTETHCKWNHEFTEANTIITVGGTRRCKACARRRSQESYLRRKAQGLVREQKSTAYEPPVRPAPRPTETHWHERARCAGEMDRWVPDPVGKSMEQATREVRPICLSCPVIADCAREALTHKPWGVWAGIVFTGSVSADQRRMLLRLAMFDQQVAS